MQLMDILIVEEGLRAAPDVHWNNAGHQKVGALLADCIEIFVASGNLDECEHVAMP